MERDFNSAFFDDVNALPESILEDRKRQAMKEMMQMG